MARSLPIALGCPSRRHTSTEPCAAGSLPSLNCSSTSRSSRAPRSDIEAWDAGKTYVFDLRQDPRALVRGPSHVVHFYLPLATLNAFAEQNGRHAVSDLIHKPGIGSDDVVMRHLARAALGSLREPHGTTELLSSPSDRISHWHKSPRAAASRARAISQRCVQAKCRPEPRTPAPHIPAIDR